MPNTLYEIRSYLKHNNKLYRHDSFYSLPQAQEYLEDILTSAQYKWSRNIYENWHIAEIDVSGLFEIPPKPTPRQRFSCKQSSVPTGANTWNVVECEAIDLVENTTVARWTYRYSSKAPFEPFRQGNKYYALTSTDYTATCVLDLQSGEIIANEPKDTWGFCPVGFYVPDWWDIHDGSIKPGTQFWDESYESPNGSYGFVWGCIWGDDTSWKVQYLDLSNVSQGEIKRQERFGYLELATIGNDPREFIDIDGNNVTFAISATYDLNTGEAKPNNPST